MGPVPGQAPHQGKTHWVGSAGLRRIQFAAERPACPLRHDQISQEVTLEQPSTQGAQEAGVLHAAGVGGLPAFACISCAAALRSRERGASHLAASGVAPPFSAF